MSPPNPCPYGSIVVIDPNDPLYDTYPVNPAGQVIPPATCARCPWQPQCPTQGISPPSHPTHIKIDRTR